MTGTVPITAVNASATVTPRAVLGIVCASHMAMLIMRRPMATTTSPTFTVNCARS